MIEPNGTTKLRFKAQGTREEECADVRMCECAHAFDSNILIQFAWLNYDMLATI